mmetsp:Transcript_38378/g.120873  ORF Transcript_38378/g.120873 Transcript_38378/m.120873 type:complete len:203 (+) Transcript_38378:1520-2128(+)
MCTRKRFYRYGRRVDAHRTRRPRCDCASRAPVAVPSAPSALHRQSTALYNASERAASTPTAPSRTSAVSAAAPSRSAGWPSACLFSNSSTYHSSEYISGGSSSGSLGFGFQRPHSEGGPSEAKSMRTKFSSPSLSSGARRTYSTDSEILRTSLSGWLSQVCSRPTASFVRPAACSACASQTEYCPPSRPVSPPGAAATAWVK